MRIMDGTRWHVFSISLYIPYVAPHKGKNIKMKGNTAEF